MQSEAHSQGDEFPAQSQPPAKSQPESSSGLPLVQSTDLFRGHQEVLIQHDGETYRLRLTRNGKLILHK